MVIPNAEVTSPEVAELSIDQPRPRRLNTSRRHSAVHLGFPGGMFCYIGHPQLVRFETGQGCGQPGLLGCLWGGSAVSGFGSL